MNEAEILAELRKLADEYCRPGTGHASIYISSYASDTLAPINVSAGRFEARGKTAEAAIAAVRRKIREAALARDAADLEYSSWVQPVMLAAE